MPLKNRELTTLTAHVGIIECPVGAVEKKKAPTTNTTTTAAAATLARGGSSRSAIARPTR